MHTSLTRPRVGAAAVAVAVALLVAGSSSANAMARTDSTPKGRSATTTRTKAISSKAPAGFAAALTALQSGLTPFVTARNAAAKAGDLPGAQAAIVKERALYFAFDKALRKLHASGSDQQRINDILFANGSKIAAMDQYASATTAADFNKDLPSDVAATNEFVSVMTDTASKWKLTYTNTLSTPPAPYVGALTTVSTLKTVPGSYSFVVPVGFIGSDGGPTILLIGPKHSSISTGVANNSPAPKVTDQGLEAYVQQYATATTGGAAGTKNDATLVGKVEAVNVNGVAGFAYTTKGTGFGESREVMVAHNGEVIELSLIASTTDFNRLLPRFEGALLSFAFAPA
jgi:hypothetical protein